MGSLFHFHYKAKYKTTMPYLNILLYSSNPNYFYLHCLFKLYYLEIK